MDSSKRVQMNLFAGQEKRYQGFPCGSNGKESACSVGDLGSVPGKIPWRRKWQPTPVFLPGEFCGLSCLVDYSPWGCKELDMIEQLTHTHTVETQT